MVVVLCLILVAFFAGMEIAFISASRLRIELRSEDGSGGGKWLSRYVKRPSEFISTVLVGTNLAMVVYGLYMGAILENILDGMPYSWLQSDIIRYALVTLFSTLIVLVIAEYIPKTCGNDYFGNCSLSQIPPIFSGFQTLNILVTCNLISSILTLLGYYGGMFPMFNVPNSFGAFKFRPRLRA